MSFARRQHRFHFVLRTTVYVNNVLAIDPTDWFRVRKYYRRVRFAGLG